MKISISVLICLLVLAGSSGVLGAPADPPNLLINPSFEELLDSDKLIPDGWFYFASTPKREVYVTQDNAITGKNSLYLGAQGAKMASEGLAQEVSVEAGKKYSFQVNLLHDKRHRMGKTVAGQIGIEWRTAEGEEVHRDLGEFWNRKLSRIRWEKITLEAEAPRDVTHARFAIYFYDGERAGTGGCFLDDAVVVEK